MPNTYNYQDAIGFNGERGGAYYPGPSWYYENAPSGFANEEGEETRPDWWVAQQKAAGKYQGPPPTNQSVWMQKGSQGPKPPGDAPIPPGGSFWDRGREQAMARAQAAGPRPQPGPAGAPRQVTAGQQGLLAMAQAMGKPIPPRFMNTVGPQAAPMGPQNVQAPGAPPGTTPEMIRQFAQATQQNQMGQMARGMQQGFGGGPGMINVPEAGMRNLSAPRYGPPPPGWQQHDNVQAIQGGGAPYGGGPMPGSMGTGGIATMPGGALGGQPPLRRPIFGSQTGRY
jgi:hypothetical protein